jgi:tetratricopeptide (TPR) repeat protein
MPTTDSYEILADASCVDQRLTLRPADTLCGQGMSAQAKALCREISAAAPTRAEVQAPLAVKPILEGDYEGILDMLRRTVRSNGNQAVAHFNIGVALHKLGRFDEEIAAYDEALVVHPLFFEAWFNRGTVLHATGRHSDALESFDKAIGIRSDCAEAFNNRGNALGELRLYDEALASFDCALSLKPEFAEVYNNRGNALEGLGHHGEALESYERAQQLATDYADAHWNESLCRLLIGDYAKGWKKYEWRWRTGTYLRGTFPQFEKPLWLGHESLVDKTILLHAEGGLGDTLQFCRYAAIVASRGARVILEVQPELRRLLSNLDGVDKIGLRGGAEISDSSLSGKALVRSRS